jgi:hypothetical protein
MRLAVGLVTRGERQLLDPTFRFWGGESLPPPTRFPTLWAWGLAEVKRVRDLGCSFSVVRTERCLTATRD